MGEVGSAFRWHPQLQPLAQRLGLHSSMVLYEGALQDVCACCNIDTKLLSSYRNAIRPFVLNPMHGTFAAQNHAFIQTPSEESDPPFCAYVPCSNFCNTSQTIGSYSHRWKQARSTSPLP